MTHIKICGITRMEEIRFLNACLPDFAGFVFAKSRRRVSLDRAVRLTEHLDDTIRRVGVFVNEKADEIVKVAEGLRLHAIQLHGDETLEDIADLRNKLVKKELGRTEIWKAVRVKGTELLEPAEAMEADRLLLDTFVDGAYGGSGRVFDWDVAAGISKTRSVILAGGLNPGNVCEAIGKVHPYAVDVSSGVETGGIKDEEKIREFVNKVRGHTLLEVRGAR